MNPTTPSPSPDFAKDGWRGHALLGRIAAEGLPAEFWEVVQPPLTADLLARDYFSDAPKIQDPRDLLGYLCAINDLVYYAGCRAYATLEDGRWIPHAPPDAQWQSSIGSKQIYSRQASQDILEMLLGRVIRAAQDSAWETFVHHAGALAHYVQEPFTPGHAVDNALFQELFPDPDPERHMRMHHFFDCASGDYPPPRPALLGTSVQETAWRIVTRIDRGIRSGKGLIAPVIASAYAGEPEEARQALLNGQSQMAAQLTADVWHTALCLALNRWDADAVRTLESVPLTELAPLFWHECQYTEPTPGHFVERKRKIPMHITGQDGEELVRDGFGMGGHMGAKYFVEGDVFGRFRCRVALPSRHLEGQPAGMKTTFSVEVDAKENQSYSEDILYGAENRFTCALTPGMGPVEVEVPLYGAKTLILATRTEPVPDEQGLPQFHVPHVAICEPRLEKGIPFQQSEAAGHF